MKIKMCLEQEVFEALTLTVEVNSDATVYRNSDRQEHRDFGPAVIFSDGGWVWGWKDKVHRVGGLSTSTGEYHLFGVEYNQEDYYRECEMKTMREWEEYDEYIRARGI